MWAESGELNPGTTLSGISVYVFIEQILTSMYITWQSLIWALEYSPNKTVRVTCGYMTKSKDWLLWSDYTEYIVIHDSTREYMTRHKG